MAMKSERIGYLKFGVAVVGASRVDAVFVGDDLPELGPDLVAALSGLDVDDFSHGVRSKVGSGSEDSNEWTFRRRTLPLN